MYSCGLVLEGGGIRGIFTSGVLDAFMENGIKFPYVIGVSAGSCNGVSYLANNYHRMRDITIKYSGDKRYKSFNSIIKNGEYLNGKFIFGELAYDIYPLNYDEFESCGSEFCVVATDAQSGKPVYFYPKNFRKSCPEIAASCSMPIISKAVTINNKKYYDGGLTDSIPLKKAFDDGCEKCVVILTQDENYVKKPIGHEKAIRFALRRQPQVLDAILDRHNQYNIQKSFTKECQKNGKALVICPEEPLHCSTLNIDTPKQEELYQLGYEQGLKSIERVKAFIS